MKSRKEVYIRTFRWPMGAVLYDFCAIFEQDLVNIGYSGFRDGAGDLKKITVLE